jgi:O-antigen ligase
LWPIFALLPILVVGQVKAAGFVSIGGVDATLLSIAILLVASAATFLRYPRYPVQQMLPFLLFCLVVLLGVARSDPGDYQVLKARSFFLTVVVVTCLPVLLRDIRDLRGLLGVWFAGGTFVATLVLVLGGAQDLWGRAGIGEATLGPAYLSAAALVVGGAALGERLLPLVVAVPGIAVSGVALVTIGSRGPMLGAAVGLATWILLRGILRARSLLVLLVVSLAALVGVRLASGTALSRLGFEDAVRLELWETARMAFVGSPFLGMGWGDYSSASVLASNQHYPHNLFMETASELGFLGLIALLAVLAFGCAGVLRSRRMPEVRVMSAVVVVFLVGQEFSSDLTNRLFWIA